MVKRNLSYGKDALQKLDIHFPTKYGLLTPVVFLIHGGGFIAGTKEDFEKQSALFCGKGFVAVNLSHRLIDSYGLINLPPDHRKSSVTIAGQVTDVANAVDYFREQASVFGVGTGRMFMAGHSAGAVLAMLYAQGEHNAGIRGVANWAGLTELSLPPDAILSKMDARWKELLFRAAGALPNGENEERYLRVNPSYVTKSGRGIPHISVFPENNQIFGLPYEKELQYGHTVDYHRLLREKGIPEKLIVVEGENHGFRLRAHSWQQVVDSTAAFFLDIASRL